VTQITSYLRSNGVDAEVIACAGYYCFRGGDPPGGWIVPHLLGFSLDGMTFGDWLRAYHDMHAAHVAYRRDHFSNGGRGFEPLHTKWLARLLDHQRSTAKGRAELREIGHRLSRFQGSLTRC
jgi:hypothetical protein